MSLTITNLHVAAHDTPILKGVDLTIKPGEIHALMGPNGSGKSTLGNSLMGHPSYTITQGTIKVAKNNLTQAAPEDRALAGLFLAFQHPIAVAGVSTINFLRAAYQQLYPQDQLSAIDFFKRLKTIAADLGITEDILKRPVNDNLSGGERKKMETLQLLVLRPKFIILDELDTGTDVDSLKTIGTAVSSLFKRKTQNAKSKSNKPPKSASETSERRNIETQQSPGLLLITHYNRIFRYIQPHHVHIIKSGQIVKSGDFSLVEQVEKSGYEQF
jgi:Fe-S cluster assembly ATP-binding protein